MDERELKLNSLARYSKTSPLYVLEEYGHCEIPAGCGGVVLRWRDPRAGVPLHMNMYVNGECDIRLDGAPLPSARPLVPFGKHVLSFDVTGTDPAYTVLSFAALHPPPAERGPVTPRGPEEAPFSLLTVADGSWTYTLDEPADDAWRRPGFDDAGWPPMDLREGRRPPEDPKRDMDRYRFEWLERLGAAPLGIEDGTRVWIRTEFEVPGPAAEEEGGDA
ncbi:hypothetical protein [Spirillospora sp. NPDC029432]|uniref:hypothetical protein n=1 Tax=Spirillospora sp. NPDC029432 TaxID=3154599 RepID=UPI003452A8AD